MGFLGIGGDDAPTPIHVDLDSGTQALENKQVQQAQQPSSYYSGILNQNIGSASQLGQTESRATQSAASLGMDPNQFHAIRRAYSGLAEQGINQLKSHNEIQGQLMKSDYLNQMSKAMLAQQQQAVNQSQFLTNAYMQQEQARAQTVNSLFQVGDQIIGMNAKMQGGVPKSSTSALDVSNAKTTSGADYNLESNMQTNYGQYGGIS